MSIAMIPAARGFENACSSVFLIRPARVTKTTYFASVKSRTVSSARTFSSLLERQVDDRLPARCRADLGQLVDLQPVEPAAVGEDENVGVRRRDEEVLDDVLFLRHHADLALPAAALFAVERQSGERLM
jgi:hypothetical protein